jgi:hypothetical protein
MAKARSSARRPRASNPVKGDDYRRPMLRLPEDTFAEPSAAARAIGQPQWRVVMNAVKAYIGTGPVLDATDRDIGGCQWIPSSVTHRKEGRHVEATRRDSRCRVDRGSWRSRRRRQAPGTDGQTGRVSQRVQITTDGLKVYSAVESAFSRMSTTQRFRRFTERLNAARRYSPAKIVSSTLEVIKGTPDPKHISTSYVERLNWSTRTSMRRYTRLSNGFSRKLENHEAAVALNYFAYNFIRIHRTLRVTPAMAAGVTNRLFDVSDLVNLLIEAESKSRIASARLRQWIHRQSGSLAWFGSLRSSYCTTYRSDLKTGGWIRTQ